MPYNFNVLEKKKQINKRKYLHTISNCLATESFFTSLVSRLIWREFDELTDFTTCKSASQHNILLLYAKILCLFSKQKTRPSAFMNYTYLLAPFVLNKYKTFHIWRAHCHLGLTAHLVFQPNSPVSTVQTSDCFAEKLTLWTGRLCAFALFSWRAHKKKQQ